MGTTRSRARLATRFWWADASAEIVIGEESGCQRGGGRIKFFLSVRRGFGAIDTDLTTSRFPPKLSTCQKNEMRPVAAFQVDDALFEPGDPVWYERMSMFKVNVTARNPKSEDRVTQPVAALVDPGSELTWLPADVLRSAGITPRRKRVFAAATQEKVERDVGYAVLGAEGYETIDEVVFAEPGDMTLLGVRTLEGFGVMVDNIGHRFVATTTIVA